MTLRVFGDICRSVVMKYNDGIRTEVHTITDRGDDRYPTLPIDDVIKELPNNDAIIFGSPTRFGNMAAPMKSMWDGTTELWTNGSLVGKIGAVFTSAASVHGGQETTTVSMMFPIFHHGMILVGVLIQLKS